MGSIRVVTDSASDLDASMAADKGIDVVELDVRLGDMGPEVTRTWSPTQFWQECAKVSVLPETSAPSPGAFAQAFAAAGEGGADGVVCVTISSKLSATYQSAVAGASEVADRIPVKVIDSGFATMGEGLIALAGVSAAQAGGSLDEVVAAVEAARDKTELYGTLDTLENLRKGGRIGGAQAFVGSLLSIKPVVVVRDGHLEPESKQRTRMRSLEYLASKVQEAGEIERLAVVHANAPDVDAIVKLVGAHFPIDRIIVGYIGPVVGTHTGAGTVGVCWTLR